MSTRRDFLKKTALFGASMVAAPSLIAGGREEDSFFVPGQEEIAPAPAAGNALRISGTFLERFPTTSPTRTGARRSGTGTSATCVPSASIRSS